MAWVRNAALLCAALMSASLLCLYILQIDLVADHRFTTTTTTAAIRSTTPPPSLSMSEYPEYDDALACNPTLIESIPFPSPRPVNASAHLCPPSTPPFTALDGECLRIGSSCPGLVQVVLSDGYRSSAPTTTTAAQIALGDAQQIVAKCLANGHVDTHIRVRLPDHHHHHHHHHHRDRPHVVVLVVDSVARAQFIRQFPATVAVLQRVSGGRHRTYGFRRYSTGGVGTAGNLVPVLAGQAIRPWRARHHLLDLLNVSRVGRHDADGNLFARFKSAGYLTSLMDESGPHWSSSLIRYFASPTATTADLDGLIGSMTDWTFYAMVETMLQAGARFDPRMIYADSNITALCVGDRTLEQIEFGRLRQMLKVAEGAARPVFSVSLFNTAHEPRVRRAPTLDQPLAAFLDETLRKYANAVVVVMSDHGIGYGPYAISDVGVFENKLPALFLVVPESLPMISAAQRRTLARNQERLVFPLDLYETLAFLADPDQYDDDDDDDDDEGGGSLFHRVQPAWRNCTSVADGRYDVDYKFCACVARRPLRPAAPLFAALAQAAVRHINGEAGVHPACEPVHLRSFVVHGLDEFRRTGPGRAAVRTTVTTPAVAAQPARSTNGTEIFTGFFQRRTTTTPTTPTMVEMEIGQGWDEYRGEFLGPVSLLDRDAGGDEPVRVLIRGPVRALLRAPLRLDLYQIDARTRQHRTLDLPAPAAKRIVAAIGTAAEFESGRWLAIVRSANLILTKTSFVVVSSTAAPAEAATLAEEIWELETVRRDTEFGQYEACAGPTPVLSFCLCNLSRPFTP